jgi:hypothetical protein
MDTTSSISPGEFTILKEALLWSGLLVVMASPQGAVGLSQESTVLSQAVREMLWHGSGYSLIEQLRLDLGNTPAEQLRPQIDKDAPGDPGLRLRNQVLQRIRQAKQILVDRANEAESDYYKRGMLWVGLQVAGAAREGGSWFSRNSEAVSREEREALRQLAFILGLPANQAIVKQLPEAPARALPGSVGALFSTEEWTILRQAPLWVGAAVSSAAPSGLFGLAKELMMIGRALQEARQTYPENQLIIALLDEMAVQPSAMLPAQPQMLDSEGVLQRAMQVCRQARDLLLAKQPANEAKQYLSTLLLVGQRVAEGGREGSFLGIGGELISEGERQALNLIAAALDLDE